MSMELESHVVHMKQAVASLALTVTLAACATADKPAADFEPVQRLLDLSGLAWLGDDRFLAAHDAKNPDELDRVRVSLLKLPRSLAGIQWKPLAPTFPGGPSSDLESAAGVPGTNRVLLSESGDNAGEYRRIFLAEVAGENIAVTESLEWTGFTDAYNVEATAVAATGDGYLFLWAERASGKQVTGINWAPMTLQPFAIGPKAGSGRFELPRGLEDAAGRPLYTRPVVGLDVDAAGRVYAVAAYDPEGTVADPDNGPFRSAVFAVGRIGNGQLVLDAEPTLLATVDGFKLESVAAREIGGQAELFIGTDDENYGGTIRRLPVSVR